MLKKDVPNGVVLYEGPSLIDGKPIVVIANGLKSDKNPKLGKMFQTWILRSDAHPQEILLTNEDVSICGDCIHRPETDGKNIFNRSCYVNLMPVFSVYNAYKKGLYPFVTEETLSLFKGGHIRLGAYGDPAAVPLHVWDKICSISEKYTGYTHQWRKCDSGYKKYCMASADTMADKLEAQSMGWRTFRIRFADETIPINNDETICLAEKSGKQCTSCCLCNGSSSRSRRNVCITVHGRVGIVDILRKKIGNLLEKKNRPSICA